MFNYFIIVHLHKIINNIDKRDFFMTYKVIFISSKIFHNTYY